ncbi:hypothetical protein BH09ACT13_BH09ACT13_05900 [soil metagenome]
MAKALASDPRVRYVEPNHVVSLLAVPDDPSFGQLWGLNNTGQTSGTADADIDAPEAWDTGTGSSGTVVAVSDTGVDFSHPDLAARQWTNPLDPVNGADDDGNGLVDDATGWDFVSDDSNPVDDNDHGTHVSGTIGAAGDNGVGVAGVNWDVKIMALKFLDATGNGNTADAIAATLYAADHGASVSSNSWGGGPFAQALLDAIDYGASRGMLFVAAAGNDGANNDSTATYPANYASEAIVSVAATDHNDLIAFFSNYGAKTVDLGAPGVNILSTTPGNTYQSFSGTSMATPHVSGVAALGKSLFPGASPYALKALLLGSVDPNASLAGKTRTNGRLNAARAASCLGEPEVLLEAPVGGFKASLGEPFEISVIGANCAAPAGLGNVTVSVNGATVAMSSASPDTGLYSGIATPTVEGPVTVTAEVTVGAASATQTVNGTAALNYACSEIADTWVDVTPGTRLTTASNSDDAFSTLNITFPFSFYGQTYTTAYVSSNGFLTLGSSAGADTPGNASIPNPAAPNGVVAAFWDDLNPASAGDVYAGLTGAVGSRVLHVEWFNVPHFTLFGSSGLATFEMSLYEASGEIRYRYLDTDLGNPSWNAGASATAGMEKVDGSFGKEISFNRPTLTNGKALSCTLGPPPPPPAPTITTTALDDSTLTQSYSETLAASGDTPPYAWSVSAGSLPSGLSLDPASGALTGTPGAAGSYSFTARVLDSQSQSDTQLLSIAVADPLAITTTSLSGGTVGQVYSQPVAATGGASPYSWSVASGALPPGLGLNGSTGGDLGHADLGRFVRVHASGDRLGQPCADGDAGAFHLGRGRSALDHDGEPRGRDDDAGVQPDARCDGRKRWVHVVRRRRQPAAGSVARPLDGCYWRHADCDRELSLHGAGHRQPVPDGYTGALDRGRRSACDHDDKPVRRHRRPVVLADSRGDRRCDAVHVVGLRGHLAAGARAELGHGCGLRHADDRRKLCLHGSGRRLGQPSADGHAAAFDRRRPGRPDTGDSDAKRDDDSHRRVPCGGGFQPRVRRQLLLRGELDFERPADDVLVRELHRRHELALGLEGELHGQELALVHADRHGLALDDELVGAARLAHGRYDRSGDCEPDTGRNGCQLRERYDRRWRAARTDSLSHLRGIVLLERRPAPDHVSAPVGNLERRSVSRTARASTGGSDPGPCPE